MANLNYSGLSSEEVSVRREKFGENLLQSKGGTPWWKLLFSQFHDVLVLILVLAAGVSFWHGEVSDAVVIGFIILLNAGIGFFQEFRTEKTLEALKKMVHPEIRVIREGEEVQILTEDLVPGDIVILEEGGKIPADGKLLEGHQLRVEESALTGESLPVDKRKNSEIFMGTSVVRGSGVAEIVKTGMDTEFGKIAAMTTDTEKTLSPLQKEMIGIGVFVAKVTAVLCILLFGVGVWRGEGMVESLMFSVSVAIAAVPEGLPTTITIALALGATVLARKQALVKKLSSVETLGAVSVICSDKTGTLTRNEMMVREVVTSDGEVFAVSGKGYDPGEGEIRNPLNSPFQLEKLLGRIMAVCHFCNEAKLVQDEAEYKILGDPTEGALLTLVEKWRKNSGNVFGGEKVVEIFPFDSDRKMMSIILKNSPEANFPEENIDKHRNILDNKSDFKLLLKGAPDQVLEKCTHFMYDGERKVLDEKSRAKIFAKYQSMGGQALRVLAMAERDIDPSVSPLEGENSPDFSGFSPEDFENDLTFVGMVGMIDPPRKEVKESIETCRKAGISVVVITGDAGVTARAIASELGIGDGKKLEVFSGSEVKEMSDEKLSQILSDEKISPIFARSLPAQKMRIVKLLQAQGHVTAMTGDGVNDAPALKRADIGIAMGITGTEVSKEASSMVLQNDSFASIVTAVGEGRRIYENLRKFIWFIFSCNIGELFLVFAAIVFILPMPLTAILILCIDLGTDILPAIALGVDNAEKNLMERKPRDPKSRVLSKRFILSFLGSGTIIGLSVLGAFLYILVREGWAWGNTDEMPLAMTVAFVTLVMVQLLNAFSARSFVKNIWEKNLLENRFLILAVLISVILTLLMLYVPFLNAVLGTVPLGVSEWIIVGMASVVPFLIFETVKFVRK